MSRNFNFKSNQSQGNYRSKSDTRQVYVPPFRKFDDVMGGGASARFSRDRGGANNNRGRFNRRFEQSTSNQGFDDREAAPSTGRFNPYRGGKNRKRGSRYKNSRNNNNDDFGRRGNSDNNWFKVQIPLGKRVGKEFIVKVLNEVTPTRFSPFNFHYDGSTVVFFIENEETANVIKSQNRLIETPQGFKMTITVCRSASPHFNMEGVVVDTLKTTMSERYNAEMNVLNLSSFHNDPSLKEGGYYLPLSRPKVFESVLKIINEHIPQVKAIDFSANKLYHLSSMSSMANTCKQLKSLSFKNNYIRNMSDLNALKGYDSIEELILDGNPVCDEFKDKASYISAIREKFPKVLKLDGEDLPPPIVFDLGEVESIPPIKMGFSPSEEARQLIVGFLEKYFGVYDSQNRQPLLEAYHDEALHSISTIKNPQKGPGLGEYFTKSRNLLKISENGQRSLLHKGKLDIVSFMNKLPFTSHDPTSITLDITFQSPTLMVFTVMGLFKHVNFDGASDSSLQSFSRCFSVVPSGDARMIVIVNDVHFVGSATVEQLKAHKTIAQQHSNQGNQNNNEGVMTSVVKVGEGEEEAKMRRVQQLSQMTGMNLPFSAKCLQEHDFDIQKAYDVYQQLKNSGCIPQEAYEII